MKGIIIYDNPMWGDNERATCCEFINEASYELKNVYGSQEFTTCLKGEASECSKAVCSPDDTYDFETGALISLMKMCGREKSLKAVEKLYSLYAPKGWDLDGDMFKNKLQETTDCLNDLSKSYDDVVRYCDSLREANKGLQEEVKRLKGESEKRWKNYQRNIQKKQDRINELERAYKASNDDEAKLVEYYQREIKKLEDKNKELKKNIDELFESEQHSKSELGRLYFEKHRLEEKVEKLQHEYDLCLNSENALKITTQMQNKSIEKLTKAIDGYKNDLYKVSKRCTELEAKEAILNKQEETINKKEELSVYFGGRQNGKQYTLLVELFKKTDQKKVDAAYKEAYNTTLPVWQKDFLYQMYGIHKESKEKHELPRTLDINGVKYRKMLQIKDYGEQISKLTVDSLIEESRKFTAKCVNEWLYKIPTKREQKWERILELHKESDVIIEVKREDVTTFLHEIEDKIPEITWVSDVKIFEAKGTIKDIYEELKTHNRIYFRLNKKNKLSYSSDLNTYLFINLDMISYLPPMRWDLFKKGRLAVKVTLENHEEFYEACEKELGNKPSTVYPEDYTVSICKKDGLFEIFTMEHQKKTGRKIVDWEDVR